MIQGKERQIRISIGKDVEIVAKVPAVTGGIPTDRAIRLREVTIAIAVKVSGFPAIADVVRSESGGGDNRSSITGDVQMCGIDFLLTDRFIQETGAKDCEEQTVGFLVGVKGNFGKTIDEFSNRFLFNGGSFLAFSLRLLHLLLHRRFDVRREVGRCKNPESVDEVIECTNTGDILGIKPAEYRIELRGVECCNPGWNRNAFGNNHEEKGSQHTGRLTRHWTKVRIAVHHDAIHSGEIKIPETQEDLPDGCRL